jgi:hypothetical protein
MACFYNILVFQRKAALSHRGETNHWGNVQTTLSVLCEHYCQSTQPILVVGASHIPGVPNTKSIFQFDVAYVVH